MDIDQTKKDIETEAQKIKLYRIQEKERQKIAAAKALKQRSQPPPKPKKSQKSSVRMSPQPDYSQIQHGRRDSAPGTQVQNKDSLRSQLLDQIKEEQLER